MKPRSKFESQAVPGLRVSASEGDPGLHYWGKSRGEKEEIAWHPLAYHSLDVAACGRLLLERDDLRRARLAGRSGLAEGELVDWATYLLALHDVGKFADGFQTLRADLLWHLQRRRSTAPYFEKHDLLGYRVLTELLLQELQGAERPLGLAWSFTDWRDVLVPWIQAAAGHHGRPPLHRLRPGLEIQFPPPVFRDALAFSLDAARVLLPGGALPVPSGDLDSLCESASLASWWFAGVAVAADWLGSNASWFPFHPPTLDLAAYWAEVALPGAERALAESGFLPLAVAPSRGLATFTDFPEPTPLQALAASIELPAGPQLFVLEEVTGGGKTEAALLLAHRLMAEGRARGLYFGLPTMATANAMYARVEKVYAQLFAPGPGASLVLAHSKSDLFLPRAALESAPRDRDYEEGEPTATAYCSAWLGDSRKKALLAHVGVGTIDQALLGILPVRHQSLRLWGLADKVLVVDEVHAYDTYTRQLLQTLLTFQASVGGSAILLSATLPANQRRELIGAFAAGAGVEIDRQGPALDYPLLTHASSEGLAQHPVAARPSASRTVAIQWLPTLAEVQAALSEALDAGGCACWIRNAVDDAREAYDFWRARLGEDRVLLFHSRFTVGDRIALEEKVLRTFGKESRAEDRRGRLLIATQVVEQSLDLDADFLVTDLCPIDLVVQRAGRLRRHQRDRFGNLVSGPDERGPVILAIYGPEPIAEPSSNWYADAFPRGGFVYEDHGRLWLTGRWLWERQAFSMPGDARDLIESVYGEESEERIPEALRARTQRADTGSKIDLFQARLDALKLERGYKATDLDWQEDVHYVTRLGEPTLTLRLLVERAGNLEPWFSEGNLYRRWRLSEVQVPQRWISGDDPGISAEELAALRARMPDEGKFCRLTRLSPRESGSWAASGLNNRGEPVSLLYGARYGLHREL